jgi:hypothetical protein
MKDFSRDSESSPGFENRKLALKAMFAQAVQGFVTKDRMKISVIPPWPSLENNALFENRWVKQSAHSPNTHWMDWMAEVYAKARQLNILLATSDVLPPEKADVLIYMSPPLRPKEILEQKQKCPSLTTIFVTYETAIGARYLFNPKNHVGYDAVITYDRKLVDDNRYFYLAPRAFYRHRITEGLPYEQRQVACLVGTNRKMRYRTGLLTMRKGWRFSWRDWLDYVFCPGQLITYRSDIGNACARYAPGGFDIFGEGWELLPEAGPIFRGIPTESTLKYIGNYRYYFAFENHASDRGLISERIWDALWGDAVPVYLGHPRIDEFIPRECFIDARKFKDPHEMLDWLHHAPEKTWSQYRDAGRAFISSRAIERFLPESFAEQFLNRVIAIASNGSCTNL